MPDERTGIRAKTRTHDATMGNAVSAYRLWSEVVYGVSLVGMTTVPGKYPTQGKIGITHMTARTSEGRAEGNATCIGKNNA